MSVFKRNIRWLIPRAVLLLSIITLFWFVLKGNEFVLLEPKGRIAQEQKDLLLWTLTLGMFVVVPVFILTGFIAWKYNAKRKSSYAPDWASSKKLEMLWWGIPIAVISVLAVVTWNTTHSLDPFRPLASEKNTKTIQVVSMRWKWLFIDPELQLATLNYVHIPKDTPIKFEITADSPMNSLWIPALGGQMYAMNGMATELYLEANQIGEFRGVSANISGEGFADMDFVVRSMEDQEYRRWINDTKNTATILNYDDYKKLAEPSTNDGQVAYNTDGSNIFDLVLKTYTVPGKYTEPDNEKHDHEIIKEDNDMTEGMNL